MLTHVCMLTFGLITQAPTSITIPSPITPGIDFSVPFASTPKPSPRNQHWNLSVNPDGFPPDSGNYLPFLQRRKIARKVEATFFSDAFNRPRTGGQLYRQRLAALQSGYIYTQFPPNSFESAWLNTSGQPNYDEWISLLKQEAEFIATGDGNRRLGIVLGDSLSLWLPTNGLPEGTLWLNQGISGDTTSGLLRRISLFANTRPEVIYVMAGINDLRRGSTDLSVQMNLNAVIRQLRSQHPDAQIVIQSILPTRFATLPTNRIGRLNQELAFIARSEGVQFLDLTTDFLDGEGLLRQELTTDGLHLNHQGYQVWQKILQQVDNRLIQVRRGVLPI